MRPRRENPARARWWLYVLECDDGRWYTGIAKDPRARLAQHRAGKGAKFTRAFGVKRLLARRRCGSRSAALKAEYALRHLPRPEKALWVRAHRAPRSRP